MPLHWLLYWVHYIRQPGQPDSPFCQNLLPGAHTSDKVCVILPAECWLVGLVLNSTSADTWKVIDQVLITLSQLDAIVTAELPPASAVTA